MRIETTPIAMHAAAHMRPRDTDRPFRRAGISGKGVASGCTTQLETTGIHRAGPFRPPSARGLCGCACSTARVSESSALTNKPRTGGEHSRTTAVVEAAGAEQPRELPMSYSPPIACTYTEVPSTPLASRPFASSAHGPTHENLRLLEQPTADFPHHIGTR